MKKISILLTLALVQQTQILCKTEIVGSKNKLKEILEQNVFVAAIFSDRRDVILKDKNLREDISNSHKAFNYMASLEEPVIKFVSINTAMSEMAQCKQDFKLETPNEVLFFYNNGEKVNFIGRIAGAVTAPKLEELFYRKNSEVGQLIKDGHNRVEQVVYKGPRRFISYPRYKTRQDLKRDYRKYGYHPYHPFYPKYDRNGVFIGEVY